jgi:predicted outer membrane repeat protein
MIRLIRTIFIVLMILAALIGLARTAQAAGVVGTGTPASCTEAALTAALAGGGTVSFNCGGPKTILVTSQKTINQNTIIQGGGTITLTGGLTTRLFSVVSPASLTLHDITLDSAFSPNADGGAILNTGTLSLNNVTIQNSQSGSANCGGAIRTDGVAYISNSRFDKNSGVEGGGAICTSASNNPTLQIINSTFEGNKATGTTLDSGNGGAILVKATAKLTVVDSGFTSNSAHFGGAIYVGPGGTATLRTENTDSKTFFLINSATDTGGALYSQGSLSLYNVEVNGNSVPQNTVAVGYGGGIASLGTLTLYDSLLSVNQGRFGGGLFVGGNGGNARADIQGTRFSQNSSGSLGGGLYTNAETAVVTVTNSIFHRNTAPSGGGVGRFNTRLIISDSSFTDNQAVQQGGGLRSGAGPTTDPTLVSLTSVTFSGNTFSSNNIQGGGFYNQGYSILKNVTFKDNTNGIYNAGTTHLGNSVLDNPGSLNCDGAGTPLSSDGHNLSTDSSCAIEQNNTPAQLGPRTTNNNGYNKTVYHLPLPGSPLINAAANCPTQDQRGAIRPDTCDIGAVEFGGLGSQVYLPLVIK